jgi:hypothetical protein
LDSVVSELPALDRHWNNVLALFNVPDGFAPCFLTVPESAENIWPIKVITMLVPVLPVTSRALNLSAAAIVSVFVVSLNSPVALDPILTVCAPAPAFFLLVRVLVAVTVLVITLMYNPELFPDDLRVICAFASVALFMFVPSFNSKYVVTAALTVVSSPLDSSSTEHITISYPLLLKRTQYT